MMDKDTKLFNKLKYSKDKVYRYLITQYKRENKRFINCLKYFIDEAIFYQTYTARFNGFTMRCK